MAPRVLIVDADASAARVTAAIVKRIAPDAAVMMEHTQLQARIALQQRPIDMLIIDPEPQGLPLTPLIQLLRQKSPQARIVVVASKSTPSLRRAVQAFNVEAYIEKAAPSPLLVDHLRTVLRWPTA